MRQLAPESLMKFIRSKVKSTINTWIIPYTLRRHTSSQVDPYTNSVSSIYQCHF